MTWRLFTLFFVSHYYIPLWNKFILKTIWDLFFLYFADGWRGEVQPEARIWALHSSGRVLLRWPICFCYQIWFFGQIHLNIWCTLLLLLLLFKKKKKKRRRRRYLLNHTGKIIQISWACSVTIFVFCFYFLFLWYTSTTTRELRRKHRAHFVQIIILKAINSNIWIRFLLSKWKIWDIFLWQNCSYVGWRIWDISIIKSMLWIPWMGCQDKEKSQFGLI